MKGIFSKPCNPKPCNPNPKPAIKAPDHRLEGGRVSRDCATRVINGSSYMAHGFVYLGLGLRGCPAHTVLSPIVFYNPKP